MKLLTLALLISTILTGPLASAAAGGNSGGGGGSVSTSSPADVRAVIDDLLGNGKITEYFFWLGTTMSSIKDPDVRTVITRVTKVTEPTPRDQFHNVWKGHYGFKTNGPCVGADGAQQAAVSANKPDSIICFSLPLLTRIPKVQLKAALVALTAHEISHQYGANEAVAKKVEALFSGWVQQINQLGSFSDDFDQIEFNINGEVLDLTTHFDGPVSRGLRCMNLGIVIGKTVALESTYGDLDPSMGVRKSESVQSDFHDVFWNNSFDAQGVCSSKAPTLTAAEEKILLDYYKPLAKQLKVLQATLPIAIIN